MHLHIENVINIEGDSRCGFHVVAQHLGKGEESHRLNHTTHIT
jgi:hypothetical protein